MADQDFSEIARLSERFSKDPKSRIFVQLADAYRKNGMVDEALEVLKQGLKHHPQYPLAHLIMGRCYFDKRLYTQAKESFETTIKYDPQNIVALRTLVQVTENLKDEAGQIAAYKGLLAVDPTDNIAREKLNALEAMQKKQSFYTITMAEEYERQGNLTEALKIYEQLSFTDPTDLVIQERLKNLRQRLNTSVETPVTRSETKVEGLEQFESYIKPHEINLNAQPAPPTAEKAVISEIAMETKETAMPSESRTEPAAPAAEPSASAGLVSSVTDFIIQQPPATAPEAETVVPIDRKEMAEPPSAEPSVSMIQETVPVPDAIAPAGPSEPPATIPISELLSEPTEPEVPTGTEAEEEIMSVTDLLSEAAPTVEATAKSADPVVEKSADVEKIEEPSSPASAVVPTGEEEVLSLTDILETSKETETPPEVPAADNAGSAPAPSVETAPTPETAPDQTTAPETRTTEEEAVKKPKEEDFKSFQDWLSGLLK